jgi:hypothetical protein
MLLVLCTRFVKMSVSYAPCQYQCLCLCPVYLHVCVQKAGAWIRSAVCLGATHSYVAMHMTMYSCVYCKRLRVYVHNTKYWHKICLARLSLHPSHYQMYDHLFKWKL